MAAAEDDDESTHKKLNKVVIIIYYKEKEKEKEKFYILTGESSRYLSDHTSVGAESIKLAEKITQYETLTFRKEDQTALQTSFDTFSKRAKELGSQIKNHVKFDKIIIKEHDSKHVLFSTHFIKPRGIRGLIKGGIEEQDKDEESAIVREVKEETGFEIINFHPGSFQVIGPVKPKKDCLHTVFSYLATKADRVKIQNSVREMNDRREGELFDIKFEEVNPDFIERYNYNEASLRSLRIFFQFHKPVQTPKSVSKPMCAPKKKFKSKKSKKSKKPKKPKKSKKSKKRSTTRRRVCSPLCKRV